MHPDLALTLARHGAVLDERQGVTVALHFGDAGREWRAAREGAAVFAATHHALLAAIGDDRVSFLQGMLTNDVRALVPGTGHYAALLTQQGRVVTDLRVFAQPERVLLDVVTWRRAALHDALERFIVADDVELVVPDERPLIGMIGPLARAVAAEALGSADAIAALDHLRQTAFEGTRLLVTGVLEGGVEAVLCCGSEVVAPPLFESCVEAGARPLGLEALDVIRVERGVPWAGIDMDESTLLMETGCEGAISFTKGCYLGQEVVERVTARGHVNRHLTGLLVDAADRPLRGSRVVAAGAEVGYVTSAVHSHALDRVIALAMLQRKHAAPGERVVVADGVGATVTALPFVPAVRLEPRTAAS